MSYRGKKRTEVAPHLYAISDNAYSNMLRGNDHPLDNLAELLRCSVDPWAEKQRSKDKTDIEQPCLDVRTAVSSMERERERERERIDRQTQMVGMSKSIEQQH